MKTPYHKGEIQVQALARQSENAQRIGRMISKRIPESAISFVEQQSMLVVSSLDKNGKVWASILFGQPGFIKVMNTDLILMDTEKLLSSTSDVFWKNITHNPQIGALVIELSSRRRLRINGRIHSENQSHFGFAVEQAFPNCPKYIQRRALTLKPGFTPKTELEISQGSRLTPDQIESISKADLLFVGSANSRNKKEFPEENNQFGCDVSHRGGNPGFLEVINKQCLKIPDYLGNGMFNTLGNIQLYAQAGIVLFDFDKRRLLQISGNANIRWAQDDPSGSTGGTRRFWELKIQQWQEIQLPDVLSWDFFDYSPYNPSFNSAPVINK